MMLPSLTISPGQDLIPPILWTFLYPRRLSFLTVLPAYLLFQFFDKHICFLRVRTVLSYTGSTEACFWYPYALNSCTINRFRLLWSESGLRLLLVPYSSPLSKNIVSNIKKNARNILYIHIYEKLTFYAILNGIINPPPYLRAAAHLTPSKINHCVSLFW